MGEEKQKRSRESWCIIEYVLILVEIVEMNMNTIGSYCNPPPQYCTGGLRASICNNEYINLVSRETDFAASRADCSDPPGAAMAMAGSVVIEFRDLQA